MSEQESAAPQNTGRSGFSGFQVIGIVGVAVALTAALTVWVFRTYVFPTEFTPVELSETEQEVLEDKIDRLGDFGPVASKPAEPAQPARDAKPDSQPVDNDAWLDSGAYDETGSEREVQFTERELNALIAGKTEFGRSAAIDLADDLATARLLIDVPPDFPMFGGRTVRVSAGVELAFADGEPVVALRGVSVMGVPVPNAWLGNLKNVDLVERYGAGDGGFWKAFAEGVEHIALDDGRVKIRLKE